MIIRKTQQPSDYPTNSISNAKTTGTTNTYSCDYINGIVESGSNENGNWIKYNDGTMIWTGSITLQTIEINNTFGTLYRTAGNTYGNIDFGVTFISTPKIFASLSGNSNCWLSSVGKNASSTKKGYIILVNPTSETIWDETITYLAIGKWK